MKFSMKALGAVSLLLAATAFSGAALAEPTPAPPAPAQAANPTPNLFELAGGHVHVTYSTSGIDGRPHLTYKDAHQQLSFKGDEIRSVKTELGTLVSVTIHRTIDTGSTTFTVLVPDVRLDGTPASQHVLTYGITTVNHFSVIPAMNRGQRAAYAVTPLHGTARAVVF